MMISLIAVQSVNGLLTRNEETGTGFASEADSIWFKEALLSRDLVLMGAETYRAARDSIIRGAERGSPRWVLTHQPNAFDADRIPGKLEFLSLDEDSLINSILIKGYRNIALVSGPGISSWFLDRGLISDLYLTIEPFIFSTGKPLICPANNVKLSLQSVTHLSDQTLLLHYQPVILEQGK